MSDFIINTTMPSIEEWKELRLDLQWTIHADEDFMEAKEHTIYAISIYHNNEIIGMGRLVGDGRISFYLHDIAVKRAYQGKGVGRLIVHNLLFYIRNNSVKNAYIAAISAKGKDGFYKKLGFTLCDGISNGIGIVYSYDSLLQSSQFDNDVNAKPKP